MEAKRQLSPEEIEANKDLMDLKPNLEYVEKHTPEYRKSMQDFLASPMDAQVCERLRNLPVKNVVRDHTLQLPPQTALEILSHLPPEIMRISGLKELDYQYQRFVPIPKFTEEGFFVGCEGLVSADTFPISQDGDGNEMQYHPTRILIGNTHKGVIRPSFIPETVTTDREAIMIYQFHVLLHEFFHTIEEKFRSEADAQRLKIYMPGGRLTTFAEWRRELINSMILFEPVFTSSYAKTYADRIKMGVDMSDYAVAEQLCETFVAYFLGRAPSEAGYDEFSKFDFGNKHAEQQILKGYGSMRHELMDLFVKSKFEVV